MKRIVILMLSALLALSCLVGCGSENTDSNSSKPTANADAFSKNDVVYAKDGAAVYKLITATGLSDEAAKTARELYKAIKASSNAGDMKSSTDESEDYVADSFEILVGRTNRPESKTALDYLESLNNGKMDDYIIATVGNKVVINAFNDVALTAAVKYYIDTYAKADQKGGLLYTSKTEGTTANVTVNGKTLGLYKLVRPTVNVSYVTQMQIEEFAKTAEQYGYRIVCDKDEASKKTDYEIIVGATNRGGAAEGLDADTYSIKIDGQKIYLSGGSISAEAMAVSELAKLLAKGALTDADSVTGKYSTAVAGYDTSKYYTRVWGDDFDGTDRELDPTLWYTVPEGEYSSRGHYDRTAIRTNDTNYVFKEDGKFIINCAYDEDRYIGGMLMTDRTMLYKYGYVEMSAILPNGNGLWTSLWLDFRWHNAPRDGSGINYDMEIDINECFGKANVVAANCHAWPTPTGEKEGYEHLSLDAQYSNDKKHYSPEGQTFNDKLHTFGLLWDEDEFSFTSDGEVYFTYANNQSLETLDAYHQLCYIRLSAAVGFKNNSLKVVADDSDVWYTTNKFIVDYVHLYQLSDGVQQLVIRDGTLN